MNKEKLIQTIELEELRVSDTPQVKPFYFQGVIRDEETQYMDIEFSMDLNFMPGMTRCGTEENTKVTFSARIASTGTDGFIFDARHIKSFRDLDAFKQQLVVSCETLAAYFLRFLWLRKNAHITAISVSVKSDNPVIITQVWRKGQAAPEYLHWKELEFAAFYYLKHDDLSSSMSCG